MRFLILSTLSILVSFSAIAGNLTMWDDTGKVVVMQKKITAAVFVGSAQSGYGLHVYAGNLSKDTCLIPLPILKGMNIDPIALSNTLIYTTTDLICWNNAQGTVESINFSIE